MSTNALGRSIEATRHDPQPEAEPQIPTPKAKRKRPNTIHCAQCGREHDIPQAGRRNDRKDQELNSQ